MFSEGPLELYVSISSKIGPISQKEKEINSNCFSQRKSKQNAKKPQLSLPFLSASAAIQSLAELLPN